MQLARTQLARLRSATPAQIAILCLGAALTLGGMVWIFTRYRHNWYYYDEFSMVDRSLRSWGTIFDGHNGHLVFENYIIYRLQRAWLGIEGNQLVWLGFIASLAAFQVAVAALLRRLGLPWVLALLAATVITYFGPGSQNMVWEFQQNINFTLALCFVAGVVVLRPVKTRPAAIAIAALLVLAVVNDSGLAQFGVVYLGVLLLLLWPFRLVLVAVIPPALVSLAWQVFGSHAGRSTSFDAMFTFAWRLFLLSAGALVGGGETPSTFGGDPTAPLLPLSGVKVGLIVLLAAGACIWYGARRGRLTRPIVASLIGGLAAALVGVSALAWTRAFLIVPDQFPGSRYVQWIGVFILLALAPALTASLRPATVRATRAAGALAAMALVTIFVLNLHQLWPNRQFYEGWSAQVRTWVAQAVTVLDEGCGKGREPDPRATTTSVPSPQVTVALVRELMDEGSLTPRFGIPVSPDVRRALCRSVRSSPSRAGPPNSVRDILRS